MKAYRLSVFVFALILSIPMVSSAEIYDNAGAAGLDALKITASARQAAMGDVSVGLVGVDADVSALASNPAGLALLEYRTLTVSYADWLTDASHNFAAYAVPWGKGTVAFGLIYFDQGNIPITDMDGILAGGRADASDMTLIVGYSYPAKLPLLGKTTLGINGKMMLQTLAEEHFNYTMFDVGLLKPLSDKLAFGLTFRNVNPGNYLESDEDNPDKHEAEEFRAGLGWAAVDGENFDLNLGLDALAYLPFAGNGLRFNVGGETIFYDLLALRAGYRVNAEQGEFGAGFGVFVGDVRLDYAYVDYSQIDATHRFSGTMTFGSMARQDRDGDGIPDDRDLAPDEAEDKDGYEDQDGVPDPDNDHDGIFDVDDKCPNQPEYYNGYDDEDGCPDAMSQGGTTVVDTVIKFVERGEGPCDDERGLYYLLAGYDYVPPILFDVDRDEIRPESRDALARIAEIIQQCIKDGNKVEVRGHADDRGSDEYNKDLSLRRANSVKQYMVSNFGIPDDQLIVVGAGESEPVVPNTTECNYQVNRRVVFRAISE